VTVYKVCSKFVKFKDIC